MVQDEFNEIKLQMVQNNNDHGTSTDTSDTTRTTDAAAVAANESLSQRAIPVIMAQLEIPIESTMQAMKMGKLTVFHEWKEGVGVGVGVGAALTILNPAPFHSK